MAITLLNTIGAVVTGLTPNMQLAVVASGDSCQAAPDDAPVIFLKIPYEGGHTLTCHLDGLAEGRREFDTRVAALSYALKSAKSASGTGAPACVAIQGADGNWRSFSPDLLPIR